ncbi:MAG: hypothetical protein M3Z50_07325 [Actinomycetota bacterium]|nr:hypothetical protein [Actinomycetota bacterium]
MGGSGLRAVDEGAVPRISDRACNGRRDALRDAGVVLDVTPDLAEQVVNGVAAWLTNVHGVTWNQG